MTTINISVVLIPSQNEESIETHHLSWDLEDVDSFRSNICSLLQDTDFLETPLSRPRDSVAGLYAYYNTTNSKECNIRATRLAMACGLLAKRFYGRVLLIRSFGGRWEDLHVQEIFGACEISPDLRQSIQRELAPIGKSDAGDDGPSLPQWILDAAQHNYHDGAALAQVASAMNVVSPTNGEDDGEEDSDASSGDDESNHDDPSDDAEDKRDGNIAREFVAKSPLCLHCRGPTDKLCSGCEGAYFCTTPRSCRDIGWSHSCQCATWRLYSSHRNDLSKFDFLGDWHQQLFGRDFQMQENPYESFLKSLGIDREVCKSSWWLTEMGGGWSGGQGETASVVDASIRRTYAEGFAPITDDIPPERRVTNVDMSSAKKNAVGLVSLSSWEDYYGLRGISGSSPVALLCTFPLTVYYAIERYGEVPVTVAKMLKRKLRIHIVGAEKEMNFLDLFKEVGFLLPEDVQVELVFIVRPDMLPPKCQTDGPSSGGGNFSLKVEMTTNLTVGAVSGTYGDSLDPNFDCGTGPPDMVIALNAGLFAYESWRSVVTYLHHNSGVVGVFSDYNEYSGMNCAALGGGKSRESLTMNPFRQPRAMPVYSMNLPQFSNGFLYVFNEQELE